MSAKMQIPVTEAFDDDEELEPVTVKLQRDQLKWLRSQAESLDLSVGHVLRSVVNAQMRSSGADEDKESVVSSLRAASERLKDLMNHRESQREQTNETLSRLQKRLDDTPKSKKESSGSDDDTRDPSDSITSFKPSDTQFGDSSSSSDAAEASSSGETSSPDSSADDDPNDSLSDTELLSRARQALESAANKSKGDDGDDEDDDTKSMFDMMG